MRQRRAKLYRKMLQQYQLQFGFREPFQLLIDDTFALALTRYKIDNPVHQFGNVLQTKKVKPLITQCCMQALYALGKEHQATVAEAKNWERRLCNHREAIEPQECVKQCVGPENKHRYVVASEQAELRRDLRLNVVGVPMMHFTQAVMVLEPMSPLTKSRIDEKEDTKLSLPASEAGLRKNQPAIDVDIIGATTTAQDGDDTEQPDDAKAPEGSRRRKRKAPNPLSVRKPKTPRLTMEDKLQREQQLKKQKQRNAARARLEASKLDTSQDGAASADASKRKRKRPTGKKSTAEAETPTPDLTPKPETEKQSAKAKEANGDANGDAKRRKRRSKSSAADTTAAPAESSA
ncbi:related to UTP23-essential nucleolar protein that is a component of the SSU processome [Sporisorium reilianum f. sp. reilianum]|uniref:U three protein 23 n=1 Tax=Sporisorium reilianum f. sp. reilianum TaxID=72559 RepID=A0A2N8UI22_9BASI|nr:related to UTP23-essential nucleolar protein that is a component of the SSU processome [Sporisorium reilianum f. sp. reilianum]